MTFKPNVGDIFLNKYECISLVGEGAFGCVYRARDIKLDRIVAVKFISSAGGVLERFSDELEAIKNLDHPNIVRLYDYDILKGGIPCIVMEFVSGREIGDILCEEGPFNCLRICEIAQQVLDALVETHKHGIIHCDLKPENIMLTSVGARSDVVKLIDFGVASILSKTATDTERQKMLVGTPQYMAPEQIRHEAIGPWTDIYALGLILIELFTGHFVFDDDDPREVLRMQLNSPVVLPHKLACTDLGPIIYKAVDKDVSKRYQSTQEFYNDIREAAQNLRDITRQQPLRARSDSLQFRSSGDSSIFEDLNDFNTFKPSRVTLKSGREPLPSITTDSQMKLKGIDDDPFGITALPPGKKSPSANISELNNSLKANDVRVSKPSSNVPLMTSASISSAAITSQKHPAVPNGEQSKSIVKSEKAAAENVDFSSLQGTLGLLNPTPAPADQPPSDSDKKQDDASLTGVSIPPIQNRITIVDADLSTSNVKIESARGASERAKPPNGKNRLSTIILLCVLMLVITGAAGYLWYTGTLEEIFENNPKITKEIQNFRNPVTEDLNETPDQPAKSSVRFSTIRATAETMAYVAAISSAHGHSSTIRKLKTYRIIGTPTDAGIYVNNSLICAQTPCDIHLFGSLASIRLEIRSKSGKSNSVNLAGHSEKSPVIMTVE